MIIKNELRFRPETVADVSQTVDRLLAEHVQGTGFFDALDASWRQRQRLYVISDLIDYALDLSAGRYCFIGSGRFGLMMYNAFGTKFHRNLLLASGGLRGGALMDDLDFVRGWIQGTRFMLLDDSFYLGRTRDSIRAEIEKHGGFLDHALVIYDGSRVQDPNVTAMYRYWDNYSPDPSLANPNVRKAHASI